MKLNKQQQYYNENFKTLHKMYPSFSTTDEVFYLHRFKPCYSTKPNKLTKHILRTMNIEVRFMDGHNSTNNISPHKQCPSDMELIVNIHSTKCVIAFNNHKPYSLFIGDPDYNENTNIAPINIWYHGSNQSISFFSPGFVHRELSNNLREYIQDREYSEEELFQLSTLIPNVYTYLDAYKKFSHILKNIKGIENYSLMKVLQIVNTDTGTSSVL